MTDTHRHFVRSILAALLLAAVAPLFAHAQVPANYTLKWQDTFPGTTLDTTKWWWRMGVSGSSHLSAQLPANVTLDGAGHVNIANRIQAFTGAAQTGGGLVSQEAFRYGYYQVTAQIPADQGWHTAFWLASGNTMVSWNPIAPVNFTEIDGFEIDSQTPTQMSMGAYIWPSGTPNRCNNNYFPGFDTSAALHVYAFEWTESAINYFVDGTPVCSQSYLPSTGAASPANIWLTSIAYDGPTITAPAGAKATFGTVQYYVRDYYVNAQDVGYAEYQPLGYSNWTASSVAGFSQQPVRFSCSAYSTAVYTSNLLSAGTYDVQFYNVSNSSADTAATVTINYSGGSHQSTVNFATAPIGWVDLGAYSFATGPGSSVEFDRGNNCLRTSMVKFVRQ